MKEWFSVHDLKSTFCTIPRNLYFDMSGFVSEGDSSLLPAASRPMIFLDFPAIENDPDMRCRLCRDTEGTWKAQRAKRSLRHEWKNGEGLFADIPPSWFPRQREQRCLKSRFRRTSQWCSLRSGGSSQKPNKTCSSGEDISVWFWRRGGRCWNISRIASIEEQFSSFRWRSSFLTERLAFLCIHWQAISETMWIYYSEKWLSWKNSKNLSFKKKEFSLKETTAEDIVTKNNKVAINNETALSGCRCIKN